MFVLTLDQRGSRAAPDAVPGLLAALAGVPTALPFERTVGDEVQGALDEPAAVPEALMRAWRAGPWWAGVGIGAIEAPLPERSAAARGEAFVLARAAVEAAKGRPRGLCVRAPEAAGDAAGAAETVLLLFHDLVTAATAAQWRVIAAALARPGARQTELADALGVSQQYVSRTLRGGAPELVGRSVGVCGELLAAAEAARVSPRR